LPLAGLRANDLASSCAVRQAREQCPNRTLAGQWWLTPVILATQKAEIRRVPVRSQFQTNSSQDPISKQTNKQNHEKGLVE
jgi:hypothetical protein